MRRFYFVVVLLVIVLGVCLVACGEEEVVKFTVTFDTQGGSEIAPKTIEPCKEITLPENPTKEGYIFGGWYIDKDFLNEFVETQAITENITLYAQWTCDHIPIVDVAEVAGCGNTGLTEGSHCSKCGDVLVKQQIVPALGHNYGEWIKELPAHCENAGVRGHYECSICRKYFDDDKNEIDNLTIRATGHNYGEWICEVPAMCTTIGTRGHYHCASCEQDFDIDYSKIDDLTIACHHFDDLGICEDCGYYETGLQFALNEDGESWAVIGIGTFCGTDLKIPEVNYDTKPVTSIGSVAFYGCSGLKSVTIGSSITEIGKFVIYNCDDLTRIEYKGTVAQWNAIKFDASWDTRSSDYTIYCTDSMIEKDGTVTNKIVSFDVMYDGKVISEEYDEENTPHFPTGGGDNYITLDLVNIYPTTSNFASDPVSVYRVDANNIRVKLSISSDGDPVWICKSGDKVTIRSCLAGIIKLAFVSKSGAERVVALYAEYSAPNVLYPCVYEYNDAGYSWKSFENEPLTTTVFTGQYVTMRAVISSEYLAYVDPSYTPQIASGPEGGATLTQSEDGETVSFVATQAGEYVVEMRSKLMSTVVARVIVTVESAPNVNNLMSGEYTAKFKKFTATVSFAEPDTEDNIYAVITTHEGVEVLLVSYDEGCKTVVTEHVSGVNLGLTISLNEAYRLVLARPTGFGGGKEKAILYETN